MCSKVSGDLRGWKEEKLLSNYSYKNNPKLSTCNSENIPIGSSQNIPIELLGQYGSGRGGKWRRRRRYNKVQEIEALAAMAKASPSTIYYQMDMLCIRNKHRLR